MQKCACQGSFLERFIQPSILLLLNRGPMHGFSILKSLYKSDLMDYSSLDPTGLYRMLKKMEESGILSSELEIENGVGETRIFHHAGRASLPRLLEDDAPRLSGKNRASRGGYSRYGGR